MTNVIAASRDWYHDLPSRLAQRTGESFVLIEHPEALTLEHLKTLQPRYVFFPHWSHRIPDEIHESFECVIFHMTDVPFGRGGSPLQNLISRGIHETKISALRCVAELDAGPVYLKRDLSLHGSAQEIFLRASRIIETMIADILESPTEPVEQVGEVVAFKRRRPAEGDLVNLKDLEQVFDFIRMLDADGYPHAFLETEHLRLEFTRASLKHDSLLADVRITKK
ncbi:Methionyl-tRNA formyltransferase [compost metagenome]